MSASAGGVPLQTIGGAPPVPPSPPLMPPALPPVPAPVVPAPPPTAPPCPPTPLLPQRPGSTMSSKAMATRDTARTETESVAVFEPGRKLLARSTALRRPMTRGRQGQLGRRSAPTGATSGPQQPQGQRARDPDRCPIHLRCPRHARLRSSEKDQTDRRPTRTCHQTAVPINNGCIAKMLHCRFEKSLPLAPDAANSAAIPDSWRQRRQARPRSGGRRPPKTRFGDAEMSVRDWHPRCTFPSRH